MKALLFALSCLVLVALPACGSEDRPQPDAGADTATVEFVGVPPFVGHEVVTHVVAHDPAGVTRVELYLDEMRVSAVEFAPFDAHWDASGFAEGAHTLRALAYTSDGRTGDAEVPIRVDHTQPQIGVPAMARRDDAFAVDAIDRDAGIAQVIVERGNQRLATLTAPPYQFAWPGGLCGPVALRVVAIDRADNQTEMLTTVSATDTHDLDCDGEPARAFGGADCDDGDTAYGPHAPDSGLTLDDFNCDGVPGVDGDGDGVPSVATGGTDCDDGTFDTHGSWLGWTGAKLRWKDSTKSPAFITMDDSDSVLHMAFVDGGLFYGRALQGGGQVTPAEVELVASGAAPDHLPTLLRRFNGGIAILFFAGGALNVATRTATSGPWTITEIDPGTGVSLDRASAVSDDDSTLHVIYEVAALTGQRTLRYATDPGGIWSTQTLPEQLGGALDSAKITVDSAHRPHVIYENLTEVRHAVLDEGTWKSNTVFPDRQQVSLYVLGPDELNNPSLVAVVRTANHDELRRSLAFDYVLPSSAFASVPEQIMSLAINRGDIVVGLASRAANLGTVRALRSDGKTQSLGAGIVLGSTRSTSFDLRVLVLGSGSVLLANASRPIHAQGDPPGGDDVDCDGRP